MDKKNIISTMVEQHRNLQKEIGELISLLQDKNKDTQKIVIGLMQFKKDLIKHLKLENDVFYKELLKEMEVKGQDTTKTKQFIVEMKDIEKAVVDFLEKYNTTQKIDQQIDEFKKELPEIGETLSLRIETEEVGVYSYWGLF